MSATSTRKAMFPLVEETDGERKRRVAPDGYPAAADLKWVEDRANAANEAVGDLHFVLHVRLDAFWEGDGEKQRMSVAEFGTLTLYIEAVRLSLDSALDDLKRIEEDLDRVRWEAVDLEGANA